MTEPEIGEGEIPPELLEPGTVKHSEIAFESPIREALWNRARWRGVGYAVMSGAPPWMMLLFENREPAAEIFTHLVRDLGNEDSRNRLRVTIVKGISKRNPYHYRVGIGPNPDISKAKFAVMMSRIQHMEPQSDRNLQMFLAAYAVAGRYYLGVASGTPESVATGFPRPMSDAWLFKKQLIVRDAWEVGLNDLDVSGVSPTDDVIIPPDRLNDVPVLDSDPLEEEPNRSKTQQEAQEATTVGSRTVDTRRRFKRPVTAMNRYKRD